MYRVTLNWIIEEIDDQDTDEEIVDAELVSVVSEEADPEFEDRLSQISYYDALAQQLEGK